MEIWSKKNPTLCIQAIGSKKDSICTGAIKATNTINEKYSFDKNDINFKDIAGDSLVIVNLEVDIKWSSESEKKIQSIEYEMKKCTESKSIKAEIIKDAGIENIPKIILMSKNGEIPKKMKKSLALTRAIFGLGLDVITDLSVIPMYNKKNEISSVSFNILIVLHLNMNAFISQLKLNYIMNQSKHYIMKKAKIHLIDFSISCN